MAIPQQPLKRTTTTLRRRAGRRDRTHSPSPRPRETRFRVAASVLSLSVHGTLLFLFASWLFEVPRFKSVGIINCVIESTEEVPPPPAASIAAVAAEKPQEAGGIDFDVPATGGGTDDVGPHPPGGGRGEGDGVGDGAGNGVGRFFGVEAEGQSFVFVIDRSSSMGALLISVRQELDRALSGLDASQSFYVYVYHSRHQPMLYPDAPERMIPVTPEARREVMMWISRIKARDGTQPDSALCEALSFKPDVVFFLTDGRIPSHTVDRIREWRHDETVVHTIGIAVQRGEEELKTIAAESGGTYRYIPYESELIVPIPKPTSPADRAALAKLRTAAAYFKEGRVRTARKWLQQVVDGYPGSRAAEEAHRLLQSL